MHNRSILGEQLLQNIQKHWTAAFFKARRGTASFPFNFKAGNRQVLALTVSCKSINLVSLNPLSNCLLSPLAYCVGG